MFTVETVRDLVWVNEERTAFTCMVKYAQFAEEHPAGVNADDNYSHIKEIWTKGLSGEYGPIREYIPPIPVVSDNPPLPLISVIQQQMNHLQAQLASLSQTQNN